MSKIGVITDQHFGCRVDSVIFLNYFEKFYKDIFFPFLKKNNITEIISPGDLFDRRKFLNFVTLQRTRKMFLEPLLENNIKVHCLLGNHDIYHKNTSEVNSVTEILSKYPNIIIYDKTTEVMFDNTKVLLVPWINYSNYDDSIKKIQDTNAEILFGHLEIKGFLMQKGLKSESGFDSDMFKKFKSVASGHFHHKSTEDNINYLGSPYEITFADMNDPRGFHVWETDSFDLDFYQNPYKMFYKIFYDDKDKSLEELLRKITDKYQGAYIKVIVINRNNPNHYEKFMERLFSIGPADVKIEDDLSLSDEEIVVDTAEDTLTILNKYVDSLEIETDKGKIKEELRILYAEAISMER
jgi:hypothetical protein